MKWKKDGTARCGIFRVWSRPAGDDPPSGRFIATVSLIGYTLHWKAYRSQRLARQGAERWCRRLADSMAKSLRAS